MSYSNWFNFWWDIFIIILAIYNSVTFPLQTAFPSFAAYFAIPEGGKPGPMYFIDITVDAIYVIDIILIFFTSYMDTRLGDEIHKPSLIAMNYITDGLIWDVLPVVPVISSFFLSDTSGA
jgi:hypothetical protein